MATSTLEIGTAVQDVSSATQSTSTTPTADLDELTQVGDLTLADAIRIGSQNTRHALGWGDGVHSACALTAAWIAAKEQGYI